MNFLPEKKPSNFKIDSSTLWAWTKNGKLKVYGIANRRYYKRRSFRLSNLN
jgi:hypothetical protein